MSQPVAVRLFRVTEGSGYVAVFIVLDVFIGLCAEDVTLIGQCSMF